MITNEWDKEILFEKKNERKTKICLNFGQPLCLFVFVFGFGLYIYIKKL